LTKRSTAVTKASLVSYDLRYYPKTGPYQPKVFWECFRVSGLEPQRFACLGETPQDQSLFRPLYQSSDGAAAVRKAPVGAVGMDLIAFVFGFFQGRGEDNAAAG